MEGIEWIGNHNWVNLKQTHHPSADKLSLKCFQIIVLVLFLLFDLLAQEDWDLLSVKSLYGNVGTMLKSIYMKTPFGPKVSKIATCSENTW